MSDEELLRAAETCTGVVRDHIRWIEEHGTVSDGSQIDEDDHQFTVMSMRELVVSPIKGALDCLYLACTSLVGLESVRGVGHPALVRSSITASTTSLWILDDDQMTRRARGLIIARAQCVAERDFVQGVAPDWYTSNVMTNELIASRRQRVSDVAADGERLGIEESAIAKKPKDSTIVRAGADRIPTTVLAGHQPGPYVVSEWRLLSGRAHGFHWPAKYAGDARPSDDDRFVTYDVAIPLDRLMGSVRVAMVSARVALDRYAVLADIEPTDAPKPWQLT
jgi:hypothetical protein